MARLYFNRVLVFALLAIFTPGCTVDPPSLSPKKLTTLILGDRVPANAVRVQGVEWLTSPGSMQPLWTWSDQGVDYKLGVDTSGLVQFIEVVTDSVATKEGVRRGVTFAELNLIEEREVEVWPGWGFVVKLPSGWNAAIFVGRTMTASGVSPTDEVSVLFRGTAAGYGHGHPPDQRLLKMIEGFREMHTPSEQTGDMPQSGETRR